MGADARAHTHAHVCPFDRAPLAFGWLSPPAPSHFTRHLEGAVDRVGPGLCLDLRCSLL